MVAWVWYQRRVLGLSGYGIMWAHVPVVMTLAAAALVVPPRFPAILSRPRSAGDDLQMLADTTNTGDASSLFGDLPLPPSIASALRDASIKAPTAIQAASSMDIFRGGHTLLHAETGSGKTFAYLLPLLAKLHVSRPTQLLIVVPSRELALQTAAVVEKVWPYHGTRRAFVLAGTPPPAEMAEQISVAACPVLVATPRPLLALVKHLGGTDRLHSRRALAIGGDGLIKLTSKVRAVVLDEADALLLDRELAVSGPPRRKSYQELSGGKGDIKAPERFTKPTAKAVQALLKATSVAGGGGRGRSGRGRGERGRGGRGGRGRGRGRGGALPGVQLVACSATASYRLREELCRLFSIEHEAELGVISPESDAGGKKKAKKRAATERGVGGVSVPQSIRHSWVACDHDGEKPDAVAAALSEVRPRCALLFLDDDAPLRTTVSELRERGLDAQMLHEALGFDGNEGKDGPRPAGYDALRSSLAAKGDEPGEALACRLLVSTANSARGLDLAEVDCVLLYSLPTSADQYLHLAGRTGRQGRDGTVISLLSPHESGDVGKITRQLGISIKQNVEIAMALRDPAGLTAGPRGTSVPRSETTAPAAQHVPHEGQHEEADDRWMGEVAGGEEAHGDETGSALWERGL